MTVGAQLRLQSYLVADAALVLLSFLSVLPRYFVLLPVSSCGFSPRSVASSVPVCYDPVLASWTRRRFQQRPQLQQAVRRGKRQRRGSPLVAEQEDPAQPQQTQLPRPWPRHLLHLLSPGAGLGRLRTRGCSSSCSHPIFQDFFCPNHPHMLFAICYLSLQQYEHLIQKGLVLDHEKYLINPPPILFFPCSSSNI